MLVFQVSAAAGLPSRLLAAVIWLCPAAAGRPARLLAADEGRGGLVLAGQVASIQVPSWRARPFPMRLRRFSAAVRRLSQAWLRVTPR